MVYLRKIGLFGFSFVILPFLILFDFGYIYLSCQEYAAAGTVKQNYVNILLMLLRLRQACDHPLLVKPFDSQSLLRSSVEMAKKLSRDEQINLLNCLEASLAICGICNVCLIIFFF